MTSPKSIRLGGLTLIGSPTGNGEVIATMTAKDGATTLFLAPAEWSSLVRVAEVVEKAREWRAAEREVENHAFRILDDRMRMRDRERFGKASQALTAAVIALDASEDKP